MKKNVFDESIENLPLQYFIPTVCHYNKNTLLTKNGRLIQFILIKNIYELSNNIAFSNEVRALVRKSIKNHVISNQVAIWLSTVRRPVNFSEDIVYEKPFAQELKKAWDNKNSLEMCFTNDLYISIVYQHSSLDLSNWETFIKSFDVKYICAMHDQDLNNSVNILNKITDNIRYDLKDLSAQKLQLIFQDGHYTSPLSSFIGEIIYFDKVDSNLKEVDLSIDLAPSRYVIGSDTIEISKGSLVKNIAVAGIKEYQEVSVEKLHNVLGLNCSMVITEVFSITDKKDSQNYWKNLSDLSSVTMDPMLIEAKGIKEIIDEKEESEFCTHQINISLTEEDPELLDKNFVKLADAIGRIGLVCIKEDIDLEYAFWSRIPGNFQLIKRNQSILKKHIGAFSCLYTLPTGNNENIWGKPLTTFYTTQGSAYFFNFHLQDVGHTLILGTKGSGRTTLTNFLFTLSLKYQPQVLYLSSHSKTNALIDVLDGELLNHLSLPNPFLFLKESEQFEFLCLLCGLHNISDAQSNVLLNIIQSINSMPAEKRFLNSVMTLDIIKNPAAKIIKNTLSLFSSDQRYKDLFCYSDVQFSMDNIRYFDLSFFTTNNFEKNNYPTNDRYIQQYRSDLEVHKALESAVIFLLFKTFISQSDPTRKKILVISDLTGLISEDHLPSEYFADLLDETHKKNGMVLMSIDSSEINPHGNLWEIIINNTANKFLLSGENLIHNLSALINLTEETRELYAALPPKGNYFLIDQKKFMVSSEVSLVNFPKISKILSLNASNFAEYVDIRSLKLNKEEFLNKLYGAFEVE